MDAIERRASARIPTSASCKIYLPRAGRYVVGAAVNRSAGGALVELAHAASFEAGERLRVGIPCDATDAVLPAAAMRDAAVAWTVRTPGRTLVGLRFAAADVIPARAA